MGLTAGRVHVRTTEGVRLADIVHTLAPGPAQLVGGLAPVEGGAGLIVVRAEGSDWVTIGEEPEGQLLIRPEVVAAITSVLGGTAIATSVYDSDHASISLLVDGAVRRWLTFPPGIEDIAAARIEWREILGESVTVDELRIAMTGTRVVAEDHVVELLRLCGIEPAAVLNPLTAHPAGHEIIDTWANRSAPSEGEVGGPPLLGLSRSSDDVAAAGHPFRCSVHVMNDGGTAEALRISIAGPAIDEGYLRITSLRERWSEDDEPFMPWTGSPVEIPVILPRRTDPGDGVVLDIDGEALRPGTTTFDLTVQANPEALHPVSETRTVRILADDEIPLGRRDRVLGLSAVVTLLEPHVRVACFVLDPQVKADLLVDTVERILCVPGLHEPEAWISVLSSGARTGLGVKQLRFEDVGSAKRWTGLRSRLDGVPDVWFGSYVHAQAKVRWDAGNPRARGQVVEEPVVVTMSVPLAKITDEVAGRVEHELESIATDLLAAGVLVQGFCDRRGAPMSEVHDYHAAIRWPHWIDAGLWADSLVWARRYLYAVAETTWLGTDLTNRVVPTDTEVDDLLTAMPGGLRFDAPTQADRRRIEAALADVVPGLAPADPSIPTIRTS